jgi:hypothetical protein
MSDDLNSPPQDCTDDEWWDWWRRTDGARFNAKVAGMRRTAHDERTRYRSG